MKTARRSITKLDAGKCNTFKMECGNLHVTANDDRLRLLLCGYICGGCPIKAMADAVMSNLRMTFFLGAQNVTNFRLANTRFTCRQ